MCALIRYLMCDHCLIHGSKLLSHHSQKECCIKCQPTCMYFNSLSPSLSLYNFFTKLFFDVTEEKVMVSKVTEIAPNRTKLKPAQEFNQRKKIKITFTKRRTSGRFKCHIKNASTRKWSFVFFCRGECLKYFLCFHFDEV